MMSREARMLLVYDFDGVMTDNTVYVLEDGREAVRCNRADGLAVSMFRRLGYEQVILSTECNDVVAARARKLDLEVVHGCCDKKKALDELVHRHGIPFERVLYVGNDVNDREAMEACGTRACPADAHPCILEQADIVTRVRGGQGVLRELYDVLRDKSAITTGDAISSSPARR